MMPLTENNFISEEVCGGGPYIPGSLLFQWHITERCNLRCNHCYQEVYGGEELNFKGLIQILDQFKTLLADWRIQNDKRGLKGHITITGGEPFVHKDFMRLLEVFAENRDQFSFAILTNGSFIDMKMAQRLKTLNPSFIQVSMEGDKEVHDSIRGEGDFDQTVSALKALVRVGIPTMISFTAHRGNFREFPKVARIGRKLKVSKIWSDRFIPNGSGHDAGTEPLNPQETREYFEVMESARHESENAWFNKTQVAMHRALQFLVGHGKPYQCAAGDSLITIQPNGDLLPCRRMPIVVGNVLQTPLSKLYQTSEEFLQLRDRTRTSDGCQGCFYDKLCRGGLKCLSYAMTGDPFQKDPGCWQSPSSKDGGALKDSQTSLSTST